MQCTCLHLQKTVYLGASLFHLQNTASQTPPGPSNPHFTYKKEQPLTVEILHQDLLNLIPPVKNHIPPATNGLHLQKKASQTLPGPYFPHHTDKLESPTAENYNTNFIWNL